MPRWPAPTLIPHTGAPINYTILFSPGKSAPQSLTNWPKFFWSNLSSCGLGRKKISTLGVCSLLTSSHTSQGIHTPHIKTACSTHTSYLKPLGTPELHDWLLDCFFSVGFKSSTPCVLYRKWLEATTPKCECHSLAIPNLTRNIMHYLPFALLAKRHFYEPLLKCQDMP